MTLYAPKKDGLYKPQIATPGHNVSNGSAHRQCQVVVLGHEWDAVVPFCESFRDREATRCSRPACSCMGLAPIENPEASVNT